jgi:hypothetical protein
MRMAFVRGRLLVLIVIAMLGGPKTKMRNGVIQFAKDLLQIGIRADRVRLVLGSVSMNCPEMVHPRVLFDAIIVVHRMGNAVNELKGITQMLRGGFASIVLSAHLPTKSRILREAMPLTANLKTLKEICEG